MESCSRVLFLGVKVVMVPAGSAVSAIVGDCLCLVPPDAQEYLIPSFPVEKENTINIIMGTTFREGRVKVFRGTETLGRYPIQGPEPSPLPEPPFWEASTRQARGTHGSYCI